MGFCDSHPTVVIAIVIVIVMVISGRVWVSGLIEGQPWIVCRSVFSTRHMTYHFPSPMCRLLSDIPWSSRDGEGYCG